MKMKLQIILLFAVLTIPWLNGARKISMRCKPRHHYWKPYVATGEYPKEAFPIGLPKNHTRQFVARIMVPYKKNARLLPAQVIFDHVEAPSVQGENHTMERYNDGIEILHVDEIERYNWLPVSVTDCKYPYNSPECIGQTKLLSLHILGCCCLVEGGIGYDNNKNFQLFHIGRIKEKGKIRIGRVVMREKKGFDEKVGITYLSGWNTKFRASNFEVLTYDCNTKSPNCTTMLENVHKTARMKEIDIIDYFVM